MDQIVLDKTAEDLANQLTARLREMLSRNEDAESSIAIYKMANWVIGQLEDVKQAAIDLAEEDMRQRKEDSLKTPAGSAGWTEPRARVLDEENWLKALAKDSRLMRIQREYDQAQAALQQAQEPYLETTDSRFFIR